MLWTMEDQGSVNTRNRRHPRHVATILTMILLVYLALAMLRVQTSALLHVSQAIFVDASNVGDPYEDGSQEHPFDQIQKGVNASVSGDFVMVAAGVYYEEVVLSKNKSGISLVGGEGVIIDGQGRRSGIRIGFQVKPDYTTNVTVAGFSVRNCVKGINFIRCRYACLRNNTMVNNMFNFADYSLGVNDVDTSNTVDGKPIYYWVGEHDRQIPSDAGFVALIDSRGIVVKDLILTGNGQGVLLKNTTSSRIENVSLINNQDGAYFDVESTNNTVIGNRILNNTVTGFYLSASSGNVIRDNTITGSYYGLYLTTASGECTENLVVNNTVQNHWKGIVLEGQASFPIIDNVVENNVLSDNSIAISTYLSASNLIYHNNFVSNSDQVESSESQNTFDHLGQGNYWSDYNGTDVDNNGIGETPYVVSGESMDNFPLMGLFKSFSIIWGGTAYGLDTISSSGVSGLSFSQQEKSIAFDFAAATNETGFCGIVIPEVLLDGSYRVLLGGQQIPILNQKSNGTHSYLYFSCGNGGRVEILGETVVPEFSISSVLFLILVMSFAAFLGKRLSKRRALVVPV